MCSYFFVFKTNQLGLNEVIDKLVVLSKLAQLGQLIQVLDPGLPNALPQSRTCSSVCMRGCVCVLWCVVGENLEHHKHRRGETETREMERKKERDRQREREREREREQERASNHLSDECGQWHVAEQEPAAWGDTVGFVLKLFRPQLKEVLESTVCIR